MKRSLVVSRDAMSTPQRMDTAGDETVILDNLTKVYCGMSTMCQPRMAVDCATVGIRQNECFGLLGVNGAGKTSIFKMLVGEVLVTDGMAYINGHCVTNEIGKVRCLDTLSALLLQ